MRWGALLSRLNSRVGYPSGGYAAGLLSVEALSTLAGVIWQKPYVSSWTFVHGGRAELRPGTAVQGQIVRIRHAEGRAWQPLQPGSQGALKPGSQGALKPGSLEAWMPVSLGTEAWMPVSLGTEAWVLKPVYGARVLKPVW